MKQLTNTELDNLCLNLIHQSKSLGTSASEVFLCLYNTGLRCNEVIEINRWEFVGSGQFKVALSKKSGERIINSSSIPINIATRIIAKRPFLVTNHRHLDHYIRKSIPPVQTISRDNCRTTHLFRYNYCRRLIDSGKTLEEVKEIINHSSTSITSAYCYSPLFQ